MSKKLLLTLLFFCIIGWLRAQTVEEVAVLNPTGNANDQDLQIIACNGKLFFEATDGVAGNQVWVSDGTGVGTQMLKINSSGGCSLQGTTVYKNNLYFGASDGINGEELWVSDGTLQGTSMVKDIFTGATGSFPSNFCTFNDKLYFSANGGSSAGSIELWGTDGTLPGTQLVKDINPTGSSYPYNLTVLNNLFYFGANDVLGNTQLWVSDGNGPNTSKLIVINPTGSANPESLTVYNGKIYFSAVPSGATRHELWVSNGTTGGTQRFKNINHTLSAAPQSFTVFNNKLYFSADDGTNGRELWVTDGDSSNTMMLADINPGGGSSSPSGFTVSGNKMYFQATDGVNGTELWVTDGTPGNTKMVKDINVNGSSNPRYMAALNNKIYFVANGDTGAARANELWVSDGTTLGTAKLTPAVGPNTQPLTNTTQLVALGNALYFGANYTSNGYQLWRVVDNSTGINNISKPNSAVNIYPNPSNGSVHIAGVNDMDNIEVVDLLGQVVYNNKANGKEATLQLKRSGVYFVTVTSGNETITKKLVIN